MIEMAAAKRLVVELYYDVISPYSYFCFEALSRYRQPWDMDLRLKPFNLGAIMKEANNKPPGMVSFPERLPPSLVHDEPFWRSEIIFCGSRSVNDFLFDLTSRVNNSVLLRCLTKLATWSRTWTASQSTMRCPSRYRRSLWNGFSRGQLSVPRDFCARSKSMAQNTSNQPPGKSISGRTQIDPKHLLTAPVCV